MAALRQVQVTEAVRAALAAHRSRAEASAVGLAAAFGAGEGAGEAAMLQWCLPRDARSPLFSWRRPRPFTSASAPSGPAFTCAERPNGQTDRRRAVATAHPFGRHHLPPSRLPLPLPFALCPLLSCCGSCGSWCRWCVGVAGVLVCWCLRISSSPLLPSAASVVSTSELGHLMCNVVKIILLRNHGTRRLGTET
jgi:hypothetical protein